MISSSRREGLQESALSRTFSTQSFSKSSISGTQHRTPRSTASSFSSFSSVKKRRHELVGSKRRATTAAEASFGQMSLDVSMMEMTPSAVITVLVGAEQRIFAAHEDVLCRSTYFRNALRRAYYPSPDLPPNPYPYANPPSFSQMDWTATASIMTPSPFAKGKKNSKCVSLPDEEPEIFSSVLEFLYKGDYHPRLVHDKRRGTWGLEQYSADKGRRGGEPTVYLRSVDGDLLKDTVIYCAAVRYGLDSLQKIALRKQRLQSGTQCSTILASARYAYAHTPDSDCKLRAHYLALIIRSRATFKRSGTMQVEMFNGGSPLFFDLFVALCNHVDDVAVGRSLEAVAS